MPHVYKDYGIGSANLRILTVISRRPLPSLLLSMSSWFLLSLFALAVVTEAAIGPSAQLIVSNVQLAPDGFIREYVET